MGKEITVTIDGKAAGRVVGLDRMADAGALLGGEPEVFVVYDENVSWVAAELIAALSGGVRGSIAIDASEEEKSMDTVLLICRSLLEAGASRRALVVAVGGGITTDLAGFAASIYKRGVRYANVPTTLLSQVDAAIGGKTGVNFDAYKNMLGVIVQPVYTLLCADVLRTLPRRDFLSGASELLKTFLIDNEDNHYEKAVRLLASDALDGPALPDGLQDLVFAAAAVKAGVVSRDPFEAGERRKLNLGHTFAHAIEHEARLRGEDVTHGEAVSMGMILAARLSDALGVSDSLEARLTQDFAFAGLPVACPYPTASLAEAMDKDKKAEGGLVHFVLPERPGSVILRDLTVAEALHALKI
ncbi:MAG: 3-dehydroquinate synthase [Bacteroidales bacterium]|nr:3-dehydroquinate synthase [Bacteroidales bacterium]